eukprot:jgi/Botrbrau1/1710/Bobra.116_2s0052.1
MNHMGPRMYDFILVLVSRVPPRTSPPESLSPRMWPSSSPREFRPGNWSPRILPIFHRESPS